MPSAMPILPTSSVRPEPLPLGWAELYAWLMSTPNAFASLMMGLVPTRCARSSNAALDDSAAAFTTETGPSTTGAQPTGSQPTPSDRQLPACARLDSVNGWGSGVTHRGRQTHTMP